MRWPQRNVTRLKVTASARRPPPNPGAPPLLCRLDLHSSVLKESGNWYVGRKARSIPAHVGSGGPPTAVLPLLTPSLLTGLPAVPTSLLLHTCCWPSGQRVPGLCSTVRGYSQVRPNTGRLNFPPPPQSKQRHSIPVIPVAGGASAPRGDAAGCTHS